MVKISNNQILEEIKKGSYISKIADKYNVSPSAISQRIKKMKDIGLIKEELYSSYKQMTLLNSYNTKLKPSRWGKEPTHRSKETNLRSHRFRFTFSIDQDNKTYELPIKKFLRNRTDQYSKDGLIWRTTKHVNFWIKPKNFKGDYKHLELQAKQQALNFQRYSGIILDVSNPKLSQEIGVYHQKFKGIFKDKQQVYRKNWKHLYHNSPKEIEVYNQETAFKLIDDLCVIDAKGEILSAIKGLVDVQKGYAIAIQKHLEAVTKIADGMDKFTKNVEYLDNKQKEFEKKVKRVIGEVI